MLKLQQCFAVVALALASRGSAAPSATVAVGSIHMDERVWGRGSVPSLTFTVASGRGPLEKVAAFLYTSETPGAFLSTTFAPQFVGILTAPASVQVIVQRPPERGPEINESSRERFVQGALFDARTGALLSVTNQDYLDIAYSAPPQTVTLDFEREDDLLTPLVNGQDISTPPEFGQLVSLSALQPSIGAHHQGLAIFDTDPSGPNGNSSDLDLLVGLGNALMLQENPGQSVPGIFDLPDDAANGGSMVFDFAPLSFVEKVEPVSIDLIDVDTAGGGVKIFLTDALGRSRVFSVPNGWTRDVHVNGPPGYGTLDLTTLAPQPGFTSTATATSAADFLPGEVVRMEIVELGSGAIDNLVLRREADPFRAGRGASPAGNPGSRVR
ncbi:MAG: hypothetical protein EXS08_07410 [Planctomycetes bacterium]|nr:hypothetical protein [Planctomycetota bacterium]